MNCHEYMDRLLEVLENESEQVKSIKEGLREAVATAVGLWDVDMIRLLLDLSEQGRACYTSGPVPSAVVNCIVGPERYARILAKRISIEPPRLPKATLVAEAAAAGAHGTR